MYIKDEMVQDESRIFSDFLARCVYVILSFIIVLGIFQKIHFALWIKVADHWAVFIGVAILETGLFLIIWCILSLVIIRGIEWLQKGERCN